MPKLDTITGNVNSGCLAFGKLSLTAKKGVKAILGLLGTRPVRPN